MKVKLNNVRLSFPELFVAKPFKAGDMPRFRASYLIPKGSKLAKEVEAALLAAIELKHPGKSKSIMKGIEGNPNKCCWQDGDKKDYDGYAGMMVLTANSQQRPVIVDRQRNALTAEDGKPYAGCYVNAVVEPFVYNNSGIGVSCSLGAVQFVKDGDRFSGASPSGAEDFDDMGEGADDSADFA